jgi:hypothetical protein
MVHCVWLLAGIAAEVHVVRCSGVDRLRRHGSMSFCLPLFTIITLLYCGAWRVLLYVEIACVIDPLNCGGMMRVGMLVSFCMRRCIL